MIKNVHWSSRKVPHYYLSGSKETWFFSIDCQKILKYQFHENPSSGSRVVPCRQTDRHDKTNKTDRHRHDKTNSHFVKMYALLDIVSIIFVWFQPKCSLKMCNINFDVYLAGACQTVPCRQKGMVKLTIAFHSFLTNIPKSVKIE